MALQALAGPGAPPTVKLCDFGFSKDEDDSLCKTGCGTVEYVAPEVRPEPLTPRLPS